MIRAWLPWNFLLASSLNTRLSQQRLRGLDELTRILKTLEVIPTSTGSARFFKIETCDAPVSRIRYRQMLPKPLGLHA